MSRLSPLLLVVAALALLLVPAEVSAQHGRRGGRARAEQPRHGWLRIYTNYDALVTVDGKPYPRRSEFGMKVETEGTHQVHVKLGDKEKTYEVYVRPREVRTFMVDLTGYNTPPTPAPVAATPAVATPAAEGKEEESGENGKLTVYSKPRGEVYVDGAALGVSTPMINRELEVGRHEVQVKWENGQLSEVKTIRIRKGSKLKLFFRDRENNSAAGGDK